MRGRCNILGNVFYTILTAYLRTQTKHLQMHGRRRDLFTLRISLGECYHPGQDQGASQASFRAQSKAQNRCRNFRSKKWLQSFDQFKPLFHHFFSAKKNLAGPALIAGAPSCYISARLHSNYLGRIRRVTLLYCVSLVKDGSPSEPASVIRCLYTV